MEINNCRVCNSSNLETVLDLGNQPWGNDFQSDPGVVKKYPLIGVFCNDCTTFQIKHNVSKEVMYEDHTYLSGANVSMTEHFQSISDKACLEHNKDAKFVVDIGSNDGTLLKTYKRRGLNVLGVEPCENIASMASENGIPTIAEFFNSSLANRIIKEFGKADIISAANVFYHVEDLHDIVLGIKNLLNENGVFIVQGTYLPNLIKNNEFDIIYHEHLLYYRVENLNFLLKQYNLEIFDVDFADVHGGSFIAYISHISSRTISSNVNQAISYERNNNFHKIDTYFDFAERVKNLKDSIKTLISKLLADGKTIYAYGAPVKGTVMMNYCELDSSMIPLTVEVNKEKIGKYIPGVDVKVEDEALIGEPDYYFLLSWNFLEVFKNSDAFISGKRKFIVPVPEPKIITNED